jgi:hypothetical protein
MNANLQINAVGRIAVALGVRVVDVERLARELDLAPVATINNVRYFSLQDEMRMTERLEAERTKTK